MNYFQRKNKDEEPVPLSQAELEQQSDEEILRQMPWVAPRRSMRAYGRMLDWKERQAYQLHREAVIREGRDCQCRWCRG